MKRIFLACLVCAACSKPSVATSTAASAAPTVPASAPSAAPSATTTSPRAPSSLADFLPRTLDGQKLETFDDPTMPLPKGAAVGAYLNTAERKSININLMPVQDLAFSRAQFHKLQPGQTKGSPAARVAFKAFDVNGYTVERTWYLGDSRKSEARILLADKVDVTLSVQPAKDQDESIALIRQLDLRGIEAFAKTR